MPQWINALNGLRAPNDLSSSGGVVVYTRFDVVAADIPAAGISFRGAALRGGASATGGDDTGWLALYSGTTNGATLLTYGTFQVANNDRNRIYTAIFKDAVPVVVGSYLLGVFGASDNVKYLTYDYGVTAGRIDTGGQYGPPIDPVAGTVATSGGICATVFTDGPPPVGGRELGRP